MKSCVKEVFCTSEQVARSTYLGIIFQTMDISKIRSKTLKGIWKFVSDLTISIYVVHCAIWYHLCNLKNVKNTHGGVLI